MAKKKFPKYQQGNFCPQNKDKYIGLTKCFYRSSWELKAMQWCDRNPNIVKWNAESVFIKYVCPMSGRDRKYIMDLRIVVKTRSGKLETWLIEIKPARQCSAPVRGRMKQSNYLIAVATWRTNQAKWKAAEDFAKRKGYRFKILTERDLFKNV
jgi:hypothetical protein